MCSDAGNGEYKDFKVKSEIGCSRGYEATSSESGLHLNDILEMLISFDELGIFMDPVDDSFAPNYSKVIKKPMCFLKMREKISSQQYTSWRSFVEDFERICFNAMKYNEKNSEIWNAAKTISCQGKRYLDQQAARNKTIQGIFRKAQDRNRLQEAGSSNKLKVEKVCEEAPSEAVMENPLKMVSEEHINLPQDMDVASDFVEKQCATTLLSSELNASVLGDAQLPTAEQQVEQIRVCNGASHPTSKPEVEKSVTEDVIVEVVEPCCVEDVRLDSEDQATECSSSFDATQNDLSNHQVEDHGHEVESQLRDGNGAVEPPAEEAQISRRKKRALTSEWKTQRQGIEWRCRWIELRVKELQAELLKYNNILDMAGSRKQQLLEWQAGSVARASSLTNYSLKNRVLQRRQRRKAEENVGLKSYMSRHPLFSRYEKKKQHDQEVEVSTEDVVCDEESHPMVNLDDTNLPEDQETEEELGDELVAEEDSMEQLLWHIEALQMHVMKLKSQLNRGVPLRRTPAKLQYRELNLPSPQSLGHLSHLASPRSLYGTRELQSPGRSGSRHLLSGPKLHTSSSVARRRNSDYDINNVVMPSNVMANYVEPARHAFIETPHWRFLDVATVPDGESSSDEDTDDELFRKRHAEMEVKERQQHYAPWSKSRSMPFGKGSSKSAKGISKLCVKGVGISTDGVLVEEVLELPTSFGFVPKRKRRKRESRDVASITKTIEPLYASQMEPLKECDQDQQDITMEDRKANSSVDFNTV